MNVEKRIENNVTTEPLVASKDLGVKKAWEMLKQGDFRHLPVVDGGKVVGIVSDRDLRQAIAASDKGELKVADRKNNAHFQTPL